jgi:hypothetical protein
MKLATLVDDVKSLENMKTEGKNATTIIDITEKVIENPQIFFTYIK